MTEYASCIFMPGVAVVSIELPFFLSDPFETALLWK